MDCTPGGKKAAGREVVICGGSTVYKTLTCGSYFSFSKFLSYSQIAAMFQTVQCTAMTYFKIR